MISRFFTVVLVALVTAARAPACECGPPRPPLKALVRADAVFSGEIIDIVPKSHDVPDEHLVDGFKTTVKVLKSWKGNVSGIVTVHTGSGLGDCGIEFKEEPYLFYAYKGKDGEWSTNICTRTAPLKSTGEETLELDGHLPALKDPPQAPVLELKGKINDAGYNGYVFTLRNQLHERIFYFGYQNPGRWTQAQVWRHGKWIDAAPNSFAPTPASSKAAAARMLGYWRREYAKLKPENDAVFLDRLKTTTIFVGIPAETGAWRVGLQYSSEKELDAGAKLQRSSRYIWCEPIRANTPARTLSFKEAFEDDHEGQH